MFSLLYMRATVHCYSSLLIRIIHRTMIYDLFISKCIFQAFLLIEFCPIRFMLFTNEIFGQLLSIFSRFAANLNMKTVSFFDSPCTVRKKLN